MKLINKTPYIHYLIVRLQDNDFKVKFESDSLSIFRKEKWFIPNKDFKFDFNTWEDEDRAINILTGILELDNISYIKFENWKWLYFEMEEMNNESI